MALPKLNESIRYDMTIPSKKRKVSFRPYFVKEEKILLQAFESKDEKLSMRAMIDTVIACVYETVNPNTLTTFDVEYMFTQIRARSVGESSTLNAGCQAEGCEGKSEVIIDLTSVEVELDDNIDSIVKLDDNISIELQYPTYASFLDNYSSEISSAEFGMSMINECIVSINTPDERITEWSKVEIQEFVDSMTTEQFAMVGKFVDSSPTLKKDVHYTCGVCGKENKITLEGISDFF